MDKYEIRAPDVTGQSYVEQVKRTRQMLRSMTLENALEVIEFRHDLDFFEAIASAKREGKLIVSNDIHDRILTETKDRQFYKSLVLTGTLIIYEAPDKQFGKEVNFGWENNSNLKYSISFQVPKQFQGKVNCALVVEHPDFELLDLGKNRYQIRAADGIHLIEHFPKRDGWYIPDAETKIPQGEPVKESKEARRLLRLGSCYLGSVGRDNDVYYDRWRDVYACVSWSFVSGAAFIGLGEAAPEKSDSK